MELNKKQKSVLEQAEKQGIKVAISDWNPNGTNNILFVDDNGTILGGLNEALFGFRIDSCKVNTYQFQLYGESMISQSGYSVLENDLSDAENQAEIDRLNSLDPSEALSQFADKISSNFYHWTNVDVQDALRYLSVSPVKTEKQSLNQFFKALSEVL